MKRKGDNINISFLPVTPDTIRDQSEQVDATSSNITPAMSSDKPAFGPMPNTNAMDSDIEAEIVCLPFQTKYGDRY